jgi:3-oxoacyl-[acyl-carrier protein] reductase
MNHQRVALVTGSSRGIGREIALRLAEEMTGIAVHYRENEKAAEEVAGEIRNKGKTAASFHADLTNESETKNLIRQVEARFGRLDVLVNNFGPIVVKPWPELTTEDWELMFRSILLGAFWGMTSALPGMRERRYGRIINIGYHRVEQLTAFSGIASYAVAKTGLLILTRSAAASELKNGITVNMVSPGLIEGGTMLPGGKVPAELFGTKRDVAEAVSFIASDRAGRISGTNLIVAGTWKL